MNFEFCDAHLHLIPSIKAADFCSPMPMNENFCTCAHSKEEFLEQEKMLASFCGSRAKIVQAFGLHPQMPLLQNADFLEELLLQKRIGAVGEAGFDFFTEEFKQNVVAQEKAWNIQLSLAAQYGVPLVVHARKAMQKIFEYSAQLKKIRAVVFHSFAGSANDARSILQKGINAYFSFGKPLMNGAKKAIACVKALPLERLLLETDAPYQTLKGERVTPPCDIQEVYQCAYELCRLALFQKSGFALCTGGGEGETFEEFCTVIKRNFEDAFFGC